MPLAFSEESPWWKCLKYFLDSSPSQSEVTKRTYRSIMTRFLSSSASGEAKIPDKYTKEDVLSFLHEPNRNYKLYSRPVSASTYNQKLSILVAFYRFAQGYTVTGPDGEPASLMNRPAPTNGIGYLATPRKAVYLTYEEFGRLFAAIPDSVAGARDRACFLMLFWCGRRRNEILSLKWGQIERSDTVSSGLVYHFFGKGHSTQEDTQELPEDAAAALFYYLEKSGRLAHMKPDTPLFISSASILPKVAPKQITGNTLNKALKKYGAMAGITGKRLSSHIFRHTGARERYAAGQDIIQIKELLRHKLLTTTYNYLALLAGKEDTGAALLKDKFSRFSHAGGETE